MVKERVFIVTDKLNLHKHQEQTSCFPPMKSSESYLKEVLPNWIIKEHTLESTVLLYPQNQEKHISLSWYNTIVSGEDNYTDNLQFLRDSGSALSTLAEALRLESMKTKLKTDNCRAQVSFDALPNKIAIDIQDNVLSQLLRTLKKAKGKPTLVAFSNAKYEFGPDFTQIEIHRPYQQFLEDYEKRLSKMFVF